MSNWWPSSTLQWNSSAAKCIINNSDTKRTVAWVWGGRLTRRQCRTIRSLATGALTTTGHTTIRRWRQWSKLKVKIFEYLRRAFFLAAGVNQAGLISAAYKRICSARFDLFRRPNGNLWAIKLTPMTYNRLLGNLGKSYFQLWISSKLLSTPNRNFNIKAIGNIHISYLLFASPEPSTATKNTYLISL